MVKKLLAREALTKLQAIAVVVIIVVAIIGAAYYLTLPTPSPTPTGPTPTPKVTEVKIGVIQPLSGKLAETGADLKRGAEFAVDEINAAGGIKNLGGAKITIVWGDSAGAPETGAAEAERLITEEDVVALMGCYQSSVTKTASEVAESYHVPFLNPDSTSPDLTERGYKWFFRTTAHDATFSLQHVEFVNWLNEKYGGIEKVAIVHEDTEFGLKAAQAWQRDFTEAGYDIVKVVSYHAATVTSLDSEIETLKAANPDILLVLSYVSDAILLVTTMRAKDFAPKVMLAQDAGFINPSYVSEVGEDGYYIFSREVFNWDLTAVIPKLAEKNEAYKARYGLDFDGNSARDYTAMWVLYYAIEEAAKTSSPTNLEEFRVTLRDVLRNINIPAEELIMPWVGVQFDEKGQNIKARGIIVQMNPEDGKYHTVYPQEIATMDLIYPMPPWSER